MQLLPCSNFSRFFLVLSNLELFFIIESENVGKKFDWKDYQEELLQKAAPASCFGRVRLKTFYYFVKA